MSYHYGLLFMSQKRENQNIFVPIQKSCSHAHRACLRLWTNTSVSPLYLQVNSVSEESETAQTHKENLPSGRVLKINGWYLKLLNIVLDKEWAYSTLNFYLASYFQYPKTSSFSSLFSLWSITVGPSPEKEVTPNLGSPKIMQNCIIISNHITLHCNYLVT